MASCGSFTIHTLRSSSKCISHKYILMIVRPSEVSVQQRLCRCHRICSVSGQSAVCLQSAATPHRGDLSYEPAGQCRCQHGVPDKDAAGVQLELGRNARRHARAADRQGALSVVLPLKRAANAQEHHHLCDGRIPFQQVRIADEPYLYLIFSLIAWYVSVTIDRRTVLRPSRSLM